MSSATLSFSRRRKPPRIVIVYNEPVWAADHPDAESDHEILFTVEHVEKNLRAAGYEVLRRGVGRDPAALLELPRLKPDAVFNLFEGLADFSRTEGVAAGLLDWLGVGYTGSPAETLALARNKHLTKHLLRGAGLPTPEFLVVEALPLPPCPLRWPVFVKPALEDASVGVDQGSVVTDPAGLNRRVAALLEAYGPVVVEEYIDGREFAVPVVDLPEPKVLPINEIDFRVADGQWPIVTYEAKWVPKSPDARATQIKPAELSFELHQKLNSAALKAYRLMGCRDYARVDFRVRGDEVYILEVNPNPDFSPEAGFNDSLERAGISHPQFTTHLAERALARCARPCKGVVAGP